MKNVLWLLIIAALATAFALPAFAQDTQPTAAQCTADADAKAALYKKFLDNYKGSPDQQKVAYDTGKEYLGKYGNCPDEGDKKIGYVVIRLVFFRILNRISYLHAIAGEHVHVLGHRTGHLIF